MQPSKDLNELIKLMAILRAECPWDQKQTNITLLPYAIEETYELIDAIKEGDVSDIKSELGDVLLQVVFHTCLYKEDNLFDMGDVIYTLMEKLIRRHPHVFDKDNLSIDGVLDDKAVKRKWDEIKAQEKREAFNSSKNHKKGLLADIKANNALIQAYELQKVAATVGFDWSDVTGATDKLHEEIAELEQAIHSKDKHAMTDELGDCFFALVNVARKLKINSEMATLGTVDKFKNRFAYIEEQLAEQGKTPDDASLEEMDRLWDEAKTQKLAK